MCAWFVYIIVYWVVVIVVVFNSWINSSQLTFIYISIYIYIWIFSSFICLIYSNMNGNFWALCLFINTHDLVFLRKHFEFLNFVGTPPPKIAWVCHPLKHNKSTWIKSALRYTPLSRSKKKYFAKLQIFEGHFEDLKEC